MSTIEKLKQLTLVHLCIAITFFTSGLIINFIQMILFITVKPFNKKLYRSCMYYLCYSLFSQIVFVSDWYSNSKLRVYIDEDDYKKYCGKENILIIMNHTYEIDWIFGWVYSDKCSVLGNCKAYAKKVIAYMPVMGWAWKFAEFVFLERSYDKDKEIISRQLKEIYDYPDPVWLLLNAEGTRFTAKKHEASIKFAQEKGLQPLKYHLLPRTKGFTASLPSLRGKCPAIYDINIAFKKDDPVPPTISNLLNGRPVNPHMFIRRIPLENVPEGEDKAAEWLHNLYRDKDRLQESFHKTGSFFTTSGFKEPSSSIVKPRLCCLINFLMWAVFSITVIVYYLLLSLLQQNWIGFFIVMGILCAIYGLMLKSLSMSSISKSSSYGTDSKSK